MSGRWKYRFPHCLEKLLIRGASPSFTASYPAENHDPLDRGPLPRVGV